MRIAVAILLSEFDRRVPIRITSRRDGESLNEVLDRTFPTDNGGVPIRELVEQSVTAGPTEVTRTDRMREIAVTATLTGLRLSEAIELAEAELAQMDFPAGYRYVVAGEQEAVQGSFRSLAYALGLAALLRPAAVQAKILRVDAPLMIGVSVVLLAVLADTRASRLEGSLLVLGLAVYTAFTLWQAQRESAEVQEEFAAAAPAARAGALAGAASRRLRRDR